MAMLYPVLTLILSVFSVAVAGFWYRYHIVSTGDYWLWIAFSLVVYGVIASGAVFLLSRSKTPFRFSPLVAIASLFVAIIIVFNATVFLRPMFLTGTPLFPGSSVLGANLIFGKSVLTVLALYFVLLILFELTGRLLLRLSRLSRLISSAQPTLRFAIHFVTGIGTWIAILILYHWIGLLSARPLVFTAAIFFLAERRRLISIWSWLTNAIELPLWRTPLTVFLGLALLFLVAFNIAETVRPMPIGYDDMTHYMNRVVLITERQSLLEGASRYNFELLAAGISIASGESRGQQMLALSFGTFGLLIGTLFIFLFGREFFGLRSGLIAATVFLSVPMGPALAILETKPDSLLILFTISMVWLLIEAERAKNLVFFYFACFSFGLAISTKLTGAIFLPGLVIGFLFIIWDRRPHWPSIVRGAIIGTFSFAFAFAPWFMNGELRQAQLYLNPVAETTLSEDLNYELWSSGQKCSFLGQTEDMLRFDPEPGWNLMEVLTSPWHMTMNRYVSLYATEVGFLYLALIPIGLFIFFRQPNNLTIRASKPLVLLIMIIIGAITLWGIYAEHIAWYLYPVLPILSLLVSLAFEHDQKYRGLRWLFIVLLVLGVVGNTLVRMKFGSSEPRLRYAAGAITADEYSEAVFPGYPLSMEILNLYPEARILVTGSRHWYGIQDNDRRAHLDTHLEAFSCLLNRYGPDGTLEALKRLGIRYVFFSKSLMSEYESTSRPTFTKKIRELVEFSRTHLRVEWGSPSHMIYRVP